MVEVPRRKFRMTDNNGRTRDRSSKWKWEEKLEAEQWWEYDEMVI